MPFVTVPNIAGKVYIPETKPQPLKKQKCHDCFSCQICSESRCLVCISEKSCRKDESSESGLSP